MDKTPTGSCGSAWRARLHAQINLKSGVEIAAPAPEQLARITRIWPRQTTVLAASVHTGEAELILAAFRTATRARPDLRLILAPRHPQSADQIVRALKAEALAFSRRTQTPDPGPQDLVYLADTIGEMALWYSAAAITIVAGSFADKGGHTPFEPVRFGSVVVHGPDTANHAQAYAALHHADGARCVRDADELAQALVELSGAKSHHGITSRATRALAQIRQSQPIPESLLTRVDALIGTDS